MPDVMLRVAPRVAADFSGLAQRAYGASQSVYGVPFNGPGGMLDLTETGALRQRAARYSAAGTTVKASVASVRYAKYQLKHGFLPMRGRLPQAWRDRIDAIVREEIERELKLKGLA